ncbi:MAG TPA: helix-turn-helix transcriptional regulator [Kribbellaceae bacterium]|jgi:transcriptional regulator with XRE-family HTH domain
MLSIGDRLRKLRGERGLTQEQLAERADVSVDLVKKLEQNARSSARLASLAALADALAVSPAELLDERPRAVVLKHTPEVPPTEVPPTEVPRTALGADGWTRRESGELVDALTGRAAAPRIDTGDAVQLAHEWLVADPPQLVEIRVGRRIGEDLVTKVEARVTEVRRLDDFIGGGDLAAVVDRELRATTELLTSGAYTERLGRRLLTAIAELAQLAGWVLSDAGAHAAAARRYLAGVKAAHAAADAPLAANLLSSLSYQIANTGQPREAVLLARSAARGARQAATPRVRALLADRVAWAHTMAGQSHAAERALGEAEDALAAASPGDPDPDWVYWVDRDELDVMAGRVYTELRRPLRAEPLLRAALDRYDPARTREFALYLTWLADTYIHAGEIDQAAITAAAALDLAAQVNSARARDRVDQVRRHLRPWRDTAAVQDLEERALERSS